MPSFKDYFKPKQSEEGEKIPENVPSPTLAPPALPRKPPPAKIFGELPNSSPDLVINLKSDVIVNWIHLKQEEKIWTTGQPGEGVVLRKAKGCYVCCPSELQYDGSKLYEKVAQLNVCAAMTVTTRVIKLILARDNLPYVELTPRHRIQVIHDVAELPFCQKNQCAAFISSPGMLLVWADDPGVLLDRAAFIQDTLMEKIWMRDSTRDTTFDDKKLTLVETNSSEGFDDKEFGEPKPRQTVLVQAFLCAATMTLVISALGAGATRVAIEIYVDKNYYRLLFALCILPQLWLSVFFFQALVANIAQIIGPIGQMNDNTRYFSGQPPRKLPRDGTLPHVTIQMPIYTESLEAVIAPTIRSVKAAITTYELQGGRANIFVNDDGMQVISDKEAQKRQDFYEEQGIGWAARPAHNPRGENGKRKFIRAGKFKKASNMNYALALSVEVERRLAEVERHENWTRTDEDLAYYKALKAARNATCGDAWAEGDIRVGDYILLIDSDTRVPQDCFLEAVSEMEQSPQVAILQYSSGVYNVDNNFFEKGITFFTNLIYTQIRYAVANGDVAPFVGHNAWLRWSAMQDVAYHCRIDNVEKYWSECTVSEDFEMALRLQTSGYLVRYAAYKGDGYKEGVSLTVYDELMRWEKYAYGCSELVFQPLKYWPTRGPFTKLFMKFLTSSMPFPSKVSIMAYIGTYYALGSSWILTLSNYFLIGWFNGFLDHYYLDSFRVGFAIIFVFTFLGNLALGVLRYRIGEKSLISALAENFAWVPLLYIFLGGVSVHISQALLAHMFSIDMSWGSTAKEMDNTPFFQEIPKVVKKFKYTLCACLLAAGGIVYMAKYAPVLWRIDLFTAVWPLSTLIVTHALMPIVLNPNLMLFTW
ncbi:hypothetical protein M011DRAFT_493770 [Sporormia fimetaria CBS 119925]|uniref:Uncharacterized protein n=1 Tax=Sporormia fimetaria CBS 119925 TaxID=1340428 RepID=A0A6A6VF26_9PLEO|nr:hypothetical protein M011DRAFT_493770 [Sporormia fimetaria CBS 119925]